MCRFTNRQAVSNFWSFGDASRRASDGYPRRARLTLGAPGPDTTSSSISGSWTGLSGTMQPKTIDPRVAVSSCMRPAYSRGRGTGRGPATSLTYVKIKVVNRFMSSASTYWPLCKSLRTSGGLRLFCTFSGRSLFAS